MTVSDHICTSCGAPAPSDAAFCPQCGDATPTRLTHELEPSTNGPAQHPLVESSTLPHRLLPDRYTVEREVGRGGFGTVYRAYDTRLKRSVAIKVLHPELMLASETLTRFQREAETLAQLQHPNIVQIYDIDQRDRLAFMVMPFVNGTSLETRLADVGRLPAVDAVRMMSQVADALLAAHQRGIVHRDVKPANVMLEEPDQRALVMDFGIAKSPAIDQRLGLTTSGIAIGTPLYMAPEQAEDPKQVDPRADIYSYGATFYRALTGRPPFEGETYFAVLYKHKTEPLASPRSVNPDLEPWLSDLLERCLAKIPADRFQSFADILNDLASEQEASAWDRLDDPAAERFLMRYNERRDIYLNAESDQLPEPDVYEFPNGRSLLVQFGDITDLQVDAIVSSDDESLSMGGGVSGRIRIVGGASVVAEAQKYVKGLPLRPGYVWRDGGSPALKFVLPSSGVRPGRAVVTSAGNLKARFVFHGVTLGAIQGEWVEPSRDLIAEIMESCFYHADTVRLRTIAFPLLATGAGGFSTDVCLDTMFRFLTRKLLRGLTGIERVHLVLFRRG